MLSSTDSWLTSFKNGLVVKSLDSRAPVFKNHWVAPRSTQPFTLPRSKKWVPGISGNLVVRSKLPLWTGSSLEVVKPHLWKRAIKLFFLLHKNIILLIYFLKVILNPLSYIHRWQNTEGNRLKKKLLDSIMNFEAISILKTNYVQNGQPHRTQVPFLNISITCFLCIHCPFLIFKF